MNTKLQISTVTPVYSGEKYLNKLAIELKNVKDNWEQQSTEIELLESIFVDDSSIDGSKEVLKELELKYPWIRVITLSKNFGQHQATAAGLLHSSGDWVITLDEDLQHQPKDIEKLLFQVINHDCDLVYANPKTKVHQSFFRDYSSRLYKNLLAHLTDCKHIKNFNSFRLIRGPIARAAAAVCQHDGYLDIVFSWFTSSVQSVKIELKDDRYINQKNSGYNLRKLVSHAKKLIASSHAKFLRIGFAVGTLSISLGMLYGIYLMVLKFIGKINHPGWTSLMVGYLFIGGLTLFILGVMLEYITIILIQSQGKPTFFIIDRSSDIKINNHFKNLDASLHI